MCTASDPGSAGVGSSDNAPLKLVASRLMTREVAVGDLRIGGVQRVAVQSMTNTLTSDAAATAHQIALLARAGCELVRVTVPGKADADALPEIRRRLALEDVRVPLVADIHFSPKIALQVVEQVEKLRINPGNFADKRRVDGTPYDARRWEEDRERARAQFIPLVDRLRELGVALRIGVNHGSLSDRLVYRYGDTPQGMVASALEYIDFAEDRGFREIVISMKSSIPQVMVTAYRLLAEELRARGEVYPLHLGVTEAGGGDDGRIKSAAGIATLLGEGLGDTIRVSLTEDPVEEIPVARQLVQTFSLPLREEQIAERFHGASPDVGRSRRENALLRVGEIDFGGEALPRVELVLDPASAAALPALRGARLPVELVDVPVFSAEKVDAALFLLESLGENGPSRALTFEWEAWEQVAGDASLRGRIVAAADRIALIIDEGEVVHPATLARQSEPLPLLLLWRLAGELDHEGAERIAAFAHSLAGSARSLQTGILMPLGCSPVAATRVLAAALDSAGSRIGLVLSADASPDTDPRLVLTGQLAPLLFEGLGVSLRLGGPGAGVEFVDLAYRILQATRRRLERTELIACPSCGRTLFDLEETTERIRNMTEHLKLKIAVMGCVVNGPGEMADADYGFVGWGPGKVALFVGRELVAKNVPFDEAPERLEELIRERGDWREPA